MAAAAPTAAPSAQQGDPSAEAGAAFRHGVELRAKGQLREALAELERAYRLSPAFQVLYYIGAVNTELRQWASARRAFELYLTLGAAHLSPERVEEVRMDLQELSKYTATLKLTLNVSGADIHIDGLAVESTTLSDLPLDEGQHVVRASKPGFRPIEEVVSATEGQDIHLVLPLVPLDTPPARGPEAVARDPRREPAPVPAARDEPLSLWVPWSITGALAAGWITTGALALKARHDRNIIERPGTSDERIDSARRLHLTLAIVSDVLLASTLGSAGWSAYLTWWSEEPEDTAGARRPLRGGTPGLSISGHF